MQELMHQVRTVLRGMWKYRWLGVALAWTTALVGTAAVFNIPDQLRGQCAHPCGHAVDPQAIDGGPGRAAQRRPADRDAEPYADQPAERREAGTHGRPRFESRVQGRAGCAGRSPDAVADDQRHRARQPLLAGAIATPIRRALCGRSNRSCRSSSSRAWARAEKTATRLVRSSMSRSRTTRPSSKRPKSRLKDLQAAQHRLPGGRRARHHVAHRRAWAGSSRRLGWSCVRPRMRVTRLMRRSSARKGKASTLSTQSLVAGVFHQRGHSRDRCAHRRATPQPRRAAAAIHGLASGSYQPPDNSSRTWKSRKRKEVQALQKAAAARPPPALGADAGATPAVQELNRMVAMSEVQVAALKARVSEYASRYTQARSMLKTAPQLEAEAAQLNRDYAIHKKNYEDLVARRESAAISGDVEVASGVADFRVIEPPRVSPQPVWPNRNSLLLLVLLASVAAGAVLAFVASQLRPVFFDLSELKSKLELPVLGSVASLPNEATLQRQRVDRYGVLDRHGQPRCGLRHRLGLHEHAAGALTMSANLIEQAALRLEQLRRAGATVETVQSLRGGRDLPDGAERPAEAAAPTSRQVDIDVTALAARGILVPNAPRTALADQFRVVKRPLLRNAVGKGADQGRQRQSHHGHQCAGGRRQELHCHQSGHEHRGRGRPHRDADRCRRRAAVDRAHFRTGRRRCARDGSRPARHPRRPCRSGGSAAAHQHRQADAPAQRHPPQERDRTAGQRRHDPLARSR